jgi:dTDP-4-dehydrorhamnose 3,5-epimerase
MQITPTEIPAVLEITPKKIGDHRGFFSEVFKRSALRDADIDIDFVQDNHSMSQAVGVVRGLHYQKPPFAQAKLIRVIRGAIFDVAVDIRKGSPTFGQHVSRILSADNWKQLLIPAGFAHGFATLEPDTEVLYKVNAPYAPDHEAGILWNDPALGINWPVNESEATLSDKDTTYPTLAKAELVF